MANARLMPRPPLDTFVVGDMLEWDVPTGGYLPQAAITTGRPADGEVPGWLA